ncbi:MAG: bifunctional 5,10-methylenetetrahydrofolate dehydrogenase/5,10-methenyltetrahydrofolate cyclohydrolase [Dehalococcoidia bacterium]|nr:bifunctional 5,10-methylenetetrahydrofolate dehydrogenase/5,10-methenyltetrahydrofolate cyclohydrolase [Dehalococcoidia bacterium]
MTARIIDGNAIAASVRADVALEVAAHIAAGGRRPHLSVVLVGDDPASHVYVRNKGRASEDVGMTSDTILLSASTSQEEVSGHVRRLNADPAVSGILVQMPLPPQVDPHAVMAEIDPRKDVDGLTPANLGLLVQGTPFHAPATPAGVVEILKREGIPTQGARVVVVGRSVLVGRPLALLLSNRGPHANATVTMAHTGTRDLAAVCREAEILISAAGAPGAITADMVRPGAVVIDVGTTRVADATKKSGHRLAGDVDFQAVKEVAGAITPVPGGVGPMTIAMLLVNVMRAAKALEGRA